MPIRSRFGADLAGACFAAPGVGARVPRDCGSDRGELRMRRSFRALIATGLCLAIAATASAAFAGPGDLDKTFSGDGFKVVDYAGGTDIFYGVAAHGNAPTTCGVGSNEATLTSFTAGGGFNKNFS